jgi:alpha-tubulin suppressor-like RCC1 family protein
MAVNRGMRAAAIAILLGCLSSSCSKPSPSADLRAASASSPSPAASESAQEEPQSAIAAGEAFACARRHDGVVKCWGANYASQLGDGTKDERRRPVESPVLSIAPRFALGGAHVCALTSKGSASCWGANFAFQLGVRTRPQDPDWPPRSVPIDGARLSRILAAF